MTVRARGFTVDIFITRIKSGWSKLRDLLCLLAGRGLPLAKGRWYSACVSCIMLYGSDTWVVKEDSLIRLERNDALDS